LEVLESFSPFGQRLAFLGGTQMDNINYMKWTGDKGARGHAWYWGMGLALLAAVISSGCNTSSKAPSKDSHSTAVKGVLHLESFVVNLADPEENHFLRVGIDLGLGTPLPAKEGKEGDGVVPTARVRDCILGVLSTWHSDALLAPDGKEKLKAELLAALRQREPDLGVKEVYLTDFLVQR
jgi:flagellar FliL protein